MLAATGGTDGMELLEFEAWVESTGAETGTITGGSCLSFFSGAWTLLSLSDCFSR